MSKIYKTRTGIGIISFVVLMLCGIVAYRRVELENQSDKAKIRIEKLESQISEQKERYVDIQNLKAYIQTKRYIEEVAREKLGLVYQDEIILKPEEDSDN